MAAFRVETEFTRVFSTPTEAQSQRLSVLAVSAGLGLAVVGNGMLLDLYNVDTGRTSSSTSTTSSTSSKRANRATASTPPQAGGRVLYEDRISLLDCGDDDNGPALGPVVCLAFSNGGVLYIGTASGHVLSFRIAKRVVADGSPDNPLFAQRLMQAHLATGAAVTHLVPSPVSEDMVLVGLAVPDDAAVASLHTLFQDTGTVTFAPVPLQSAPTTAVTFSPTGAHVATSDARGVLRLWAVDLSANAKGAQSMSLALLREFADDSAAPALALAWLVEPDPAVLALGAAPPASPALVSGHTTGELKVWTAHGAPVATYPQLAVRGRALVAVTPPAPIVGSHWFPAAAAPLSDADAAVARLMAERGIDPFVWKPFELAFEPAFVLVSLAAGSPTLRLWPMAADGSLLPLDAALKLDPVRIHGAEPRGVWLAPRPTADDPIVCFILTDEGFNVVTLSPSPPAPAPPEPTPPASSPHARAPDALSDAVAAALVSPPRPPVPALDLAPPRPAADARPPPRDAASLYSLPSLPPRTTYEPRRPSDRVGRLTDLAGRVATLENELALVRNSFTVFSDAMTRDMARLLSLVTSLSEP